MSDEPTIHELEKTHEDNDPSRVMITSGGRVLVGPTHKEIAHYVIRLEALNSDLLAALKAIQWDGHREFRCVECDGQPSTGHAENCRVGLAIKAAEKQSAGEQS